MYRLSHNYLRDRDYLRSFLASDVAYIGMLGPRARFERLLDDLGRQGVRASGGDLARIFGPAGLDVGGEGPEEIAAAIVGEVLAVARGRPAGFLRDRAAPIHERPEAVGLGQEAHVLLKALGEAIRRFFLRLTSQE